MITDLLAASYPWVKSLHVVSVIAWMAGLFYLPRLFVYHAETVQTGMVVADDLFCTMERRLLRAIMNPSMIATWGDACGSPPPDCAIGWRGNSSVLKANEPRQSSRRSLSSAQVWAPPAIRVRTGRSPGMSSWPHWFRPQQAVVPSVRSAQV